MQQVQQLADGIARRISSEPDLDDFLAWTAGTLEYWIHIISSSVGNRLGWASSTEVPYITAAPNPGTKSNTKWADGAMLLGDLGVLLEVKTIAANQGVPGKTLSKVPQDLAAMVALDWPASLAHPEDAYSGSIWRAMRSEMRRVVALQLAMVHARVGHLPAENSLHRALREHADKVGERLVAAGLESAGAKLVDSFNHEPLTWQIRGDAYEALLLGWLVPLTDSS
jgi:hypothetical protein